MLNENKGFFNENSGLVIIWVDYIKSNINTIDNIPSLRNLKDVVMSVLEGVP